MQVLTIPCKKQSPRIGRSAKKELRFRPSILFERGAGPQLHPGAVGAAGVGLHVQPRLVESRNGAWGD